MIKLAANISMMFTELPYPDRFEQAALAGFDGVESLVPYDLPADQTNAALVRAGLKLALINTPFSFDPAHVVPAAACPDQTADWRQMMGRVLTFANDTRPDLIHVISGDATGTDARDCFCENLRWLTNQAPSQRFTIEPLNPDDRSGYFLGRYDLAAEILETLNHPNIGLQYDCYHAQKIEGDACEVWSRYAPLITHVQLSATPDRREPSAGDIDFGALFTAIHSSGYSGWISGEYIPSTQTQDTLGWMAQLRDHSP